MIFNKKQVAGFDKYANDSEIHEFLERWGPIESLEIIQDPQTKRHKGYCFVKFVNVSITK